VIASWNAGQLGFFFRPSYNKIGWSLNSYEYYKVLKRRKNISYLKEKIVDYILDYDIDQYWHFIVTKN
jgi:hypothetical protein